MSVDHVLKKLEKVSRGQDGWTARCPAHEDKKPSLSIRLGEDGRILLKCHRQCTLDSILSRLSLTERDLFPDSSASQSPRLGRPEAVYPYRDRHGTLLFEVVRFPGKEFRQRRPDPENPSQYVWNITGVERVLYRLPEVVDAVAGSKPVYVVEGEKDVEALVRAGVVATCNPGGAGKWKSEYNQYFIGANVYVIADADAPGQEHARQVCESLRAVAARVTVLEPAEGKDAHDHLAAGHGIEAFREVLDAEEPDELPFVLSLEELLRKPESIQRPSPVVPHLAWTGRATLLFAREKAGKSTLATAAGSAVSRGKSFLDSPTLPGTVLWVALDEHIDDLVRRLHEHRAHPPRVRIITHLPEGPRSLEKAAQQLQPVLVVVDTLADYAEKTVSDAGSSTEWNRLLKPLIRLAREHGFALLILHHSRKSDGDYRDSSAIGASVDMMIQMDGPCESNTRKLRMTGRWSEPDLRIELTDGQYRPLGSTEAQLENKVLEFITNNPGCSKRAVREGVNGTGARIDDAVQRLIDRGLVEDEGSGSRRAYVAVGSGDTVSCVSPSVRGDDTPTTSCPRPPTETVSSVPNTLGGHETRLGAQPGPPSAPAASTALEEAPPGAAEGEIADGAARPSMRAELSVAGDAGADR